MDKAGIHRAVIHRAGIHRAVTHLGQAYIGQSYIGQSHIGRAYNVIGQLHNVIGRAGNASADQGVKRMRLGEVWLSPPCFTYCKLGPINGEHQYRDAKNPLRKPIKGTEKGEQAEEADSLV